MLAKFLIVDDDVGEATSLKMVFEKHKYVCDIAATGKEAKELLKKTFYNIVFLDIKLPDVSGVRLLSYVKDSHEDTLIVMITAYATLDTAVLCLNEGASAYLLKPLDIASMINVIRNMLILQKQKLQNKRIEGIIVSRLDDQDELYDTKFNRLEKKIETLETVKLEKKQLTILAVAITAFSSIIIALIQAII